MRFRSALTAGASAGCAAAFGPGAGAGAGCAAASGLGASGLGALGLGASGLAASGLAGSGLAASACAHNRAGPTENVKTTASAKEGRNRDSHMLLASQVTNSTQFLRAYIPQRTAPRDRPAGSGL